MADVIRTRRRKPPKPPVTVEVRLGDWATRGSVGAELEGRHILVDRGIPGESAVALVDRRRAPWRGIALEILLASPDRVAPPCAYFLQNCGGCQWQHLSYEAQLKAKGRLVDREMHTAGVDARVAEVHPMANPWRYRRTAAIALGWEAGFRPQGRRGIVEVHDCLISHPLIGLLADRLNRLLQSRLLPCYHGKIWLDCTVVGMDHDPGLQILIQGIEGLTLESHPELPDVARTLGSIEGVWSVAYRHRSGEPRPLLGDLMSTIEVAGRPVYVPAGSFFQTNIQMLLLVLRRMSEALGSRHVGSAADIYGGVGTLGLALAPQVDTMTLVELDALAVSAARRTAAEWKLDNVSCVPLHAERALPELPPLDLAIVDPPRSGLGERVVTSLVANGAPFVLYLSCAPASLARDLASLQTAGYRVTTLEIFDFYPHTYHVESLAILER